MSCDKVITVQELETDKKHSTYYREVITGKSGGTGADIDFATNAVTGQIQKTLTKAINELGGMGYARVGTFKTGATLTTARDTLLWDIADGGDGQEYGWSGSFPKVVPANSTPASTGGIGEARWMSRFDPDLRDYVLNATTATFKSEGGYSAVDNMVLGRINGVTGTVAHKVGNIYSTGGAVWRCLVSGIANAISDFSQINFMSIKDFGAVGDGVTDDSAAFSASNGAGGTTHISDDVFVASPPPLLQMALVGGAYSTLKQKDTTGNHLSFYNCNGGLLSDLIVDCNKAGANTQGHQIVIKDGSENIIENIRLNNLRGSGFGILAYTDQQQVIQNQIIKSIIGKYDVTQLNATSGCVLLAGGTTSVVSGVIASGYGQFGAFELKNENSTHNSATDIISENCDSAVYYGTDTGTSASLNIVSNVIAKNNRSSCLNLDRANANIFQGIIADFTKSEATQAYGVNVSGNKNVIDNLMTFGITGTTPSGQNQTGYPVRCRSGASENYVSLFPHHTAKNLMTLDAGATKNFIEIKHMGHRVDLFSVGQSSIGGKETVDGSASSNVVHSPSTGQYFGSMSGTFEWRINDLTLPSSTLFSTDKFRFTASGDVGMAVGGGATARLKLFNSSGDSKQIELPADGQLRVTTAQNKYIRFGSTSVIPSVTNDYALGGASNAWSGGFTQTAFTVTSDERKKTAPLDITDAMLDAAAEVDWVQYQYLDRIEAKGSDGARWHFGAVAQRYVEAFNRHGLNAHDFGFICYDEWDDHPAVVNIIPAVFDGYGNEVEPERTEIVSAAVESGSLYGIRYEEALALEAALQRRNYQRLLARVEALEDK